MPNLPFDIAEALEQHEKIKIESLLHGYYPMTRLDHEKVITNLRLTLQGIRITIIMGCFYYK